MSEANTYTITKVMQLIPLNEGDQSFNVDFYLKAKEDFHFVIVDQEQLDAGNPLDYKQSDEGEVSGNITSNEGEFKSYYIGLKALSEKVDVTVSLAHKPVVSVENDKPEDEYYDDYVDYPQEQEHQQHPVQHPVQHQQQQHPVQQHPQQQHPQQHQQQHPQQHQQQHQQHQQEQQPLRPSVTRVDSPNTKKTEKWKIYIALGVAIIVIIVGISLYYFSDKNKNNKNKSDKSDSIESLSDVPLVESSKTSSLLDKLKSIPGISSHKRSLRKTKTT